MFFFIRNSSIRNSNEICEKNEETPVPALLFHFSKKITNLPI